MMFSEEQMRAIVEDSQEEIKRRVIERVIGNASSKAEWVVRDVIETTVREWMEAEVAPEIKARLVEQKSALIEAAIASAGTMAEMIAKAMVASLGENLSSSYKRDKILKQMFD